MLKTITTLLILTTLALADGPLLQTGQVKSYDADGTIVSDGSIEDDGYYQIGKSREYSRSAVGVVRDHVTGLEWQDNVDSVSKLWVTQANYDAGNYDDTTGDTAAIYCSELGLDGGAWRLPSIWELLTLFDASQFNPSVTKDIFDHISSDGYWSSTTEVDYTSKAAWTLSFNRGYAYPYSKSEDYYVRCVRGGQLEPSNLYSEPHQIIRDSTTGLQWQDNSDVEAVGHNWTEAIKYCENSVNLGGYTDWRLPNINELLSIVDYTRHDPSVNMDEFMNISSTPHYWSSTTTAGFTSDMWVVSFTIGYMASADKSSDMYYTRCVRGGQLEHSTFKPAIIMYLLN